MRKTSHGAASAGNKRGAIHGETARELVWALRSSFGVWTVCMTPRGIRRVVLPASPPRPGLILRWVYGGHRPEIAAGFMAFLNNYFAGRPDVIRPPLDPPALPPFTKKVWRCIRRIPWGHMRTYGDIAGRLSSPRAARAVGNACAANPLPILVPCHRVVGKGELGGFAAGRRWKRFLLAHESRIRPPVSRRGGRIFA